MSITVFTEVRRKPELREESSLKTGKIGTLMHKRSMKKWSKIEKGQLLNPCCPTFLNNMDFM